MFWFKNSLYFCPHYMPGLATYFSRSYRDFQLANKRFLYNLCCEKSSESEKFSMACYLITEKWIPWHDSLSIYSSPINMNKCPWTIILYCTAAVLILLTATKKKDKKHTCLCPRNNRTKSSGHCSDYEYLFKSVFC